ncbi:hypothetical protein TNIN_190361 [Trichonephila inaurata madagascariensis]|uniref:Uncharacterized protein n=1 Tax=Trichonephila inaurata madagascariensis TaxID=2747483 RepID=A0A8X7CCP5_9ARAC|nr:hypothetical protein TNIN_190361 [Trichonephila inaurata madagascariensis]
MEMTPVDCDTRFAVNELGCGGTIFFDTVHCTLRLRKLPPEASEYPKPCKRLYWSISSHKIIMIAKTYVVNGRRFDRWRRQPHD